MAYDYIENINKWFDENVDILTYHEGDEYSVSKYDIKKFCDFIEEQHPDIIGFACHINEDGIWFTRKDLEDADEI